eukprot:m.164704 g.164704  ORF g.164704 m.164704 type:complete len:57 (+) comp38886_c1_seq1:238-408(+)
MHRDAGALGSLMSIRFTNELKVKYTHSRYKERNSQIVNNSSHSRIDTVDGVVTTHT